MGTPSIALPALRVLAATEEVIMVVTQPDRPRGRGRKPSPPVVKELALELGLPLLQPERIGEPAVVTSLKSQHPDLLVVAAFGQILPAAVLSIPHLGCINIHPSLLPKYRGAAPINWSIINGDSKTGVTTMLMDEGMDTGDILLCEEVEIAEDETAEELGERLAALGATVLLKTIEQLKQDTLTPTPQDQKGGSYAPILRKEDGFIHWDQDAHRIRNQIRGMVPWPVAFTFWEGKRLKVYRAKPGSGKGDPGAILALTPAIEVACGQNSLFIEELQIEGARRMGWEEFVRGRRLTVGERLG